MTTKLISVLVLILSSFTLAQNWFPLEVGNQILGRYFYYNMFYNVDYYLISIEKDSIINGQRYFYVVNKRIITDNHINERLWERYDSVEQKLFLPYQDTSLIYMDYNVPNGQHFVMYNPVTGDSTFRTVFHSTRQLFGEVKNSRGFIFNELSVIMREWIDGFGPKPIGTIIQCLQVNGGDTSYYDYGYEPDFSYFQPILKTNNFDFDYIFTVFHHYDYLYSNFMDKVYLDCYYESDTDTIYVGRLFADVFDETGRKKVHISFNPNLIKNGYVFNYKVTGKDFSLIPKYKSKPDTGYYKLIYDPSPAQILFSQDSIYIPTLGDTGSVKIVNTSDHSVRIDSINSVGAFYGYRGFLSKPGFEYPFYLFQPCQVRNGVIRSES